jgi:hypothetical protein
MYLCLTVASRLRVTDNISPYHVFVYRRVFSVNSTIRQQYEHGQRTERSARDQQRATGIHRDQLACLAGNRGSGGSGGIHSLSQFHVARLIRFLLSTPPAQPVSSPVCIILLFLATMSYHELSLAIVIEKSCLSRNTNGR